jgi:hypothetical protein
MGVLKTAQISTGTRDAGRSRSVSGSGTPAHAGESLDDSSARIRSGRSSGSSSASHAGCRVDDSSTRSSDSIEHDSSGFGGSSHDGIPATTLIIISVRPARKVVVVIVIVILAVGVRYRCAIIVSRHGSGDDGGLIYLLDRWRVSVAMLGAQHIAQLERAGLASPAGEVDEGDPAVRADVGNHVGRARDVLLHRKRLAKVIRSESELHCRGPEPSGGTRPSLR